MKTSSLLPFFDGVGAFSFAALLLFPSLAPAAQLHFDQPEYTVLVGEAFEAEIRLDMDEDTPVDQVPTNGLFSMGVRTSSDPMTCVARGTGEFLNQLDIYSRVLETIDEAAA